MFRLNFSLKYLHYRRLYVLVTVIKLRALTCILQHSLLSSGDVVMCAYPVFQSVGQSATRALTGTSACAAERAPTCTRASAWRAVQMGWCPAIPRKSVSLVSAQFTVTDMMDWFLASFPPVLGKLLWNCSLPNYKQIIISSSKTWIAEVNLNKMIH